MTTINNLTIEQMREAFERHQADLTGTDYKELKAHFDNNEQYFSSRYNEGSLYERDWLVWEACWQSRQAELDQLNKVLDERTKEWLEAIKLGTYFQEAAKPLKDEVEQLNKILSIKSKFLDDSDVANKFLSEQLEDKNKRIAELEMWIKDQIETLKCASKSWVYTEREQNIMLSQADDLEKALRGEHE